MTTEDTENTERENDLQCELAAWELLREARRELDEALEAIKVFYKAKGRHNSQIAAAKMFELVGVPAVYPTNYLKKEGAK